MNKRRIYLFLIDSACFLAVAVSLMLVFFGEPFRKSIGTDEIILHLLTTYLLLLVSRLLFNTYRRIWRYADHDDYFRLVLADFVAGFVYAALNQAVFPYILLTKEFFLSFLQILAIFAVNCLLSLTMRFIYQHIRHVTTTVTVSTKKQNIAIVGAGSVGVLLAKDLIANKYSKYNPAIFVDNDKTKVGNTILDIPVVYEDQEVFKVIEELGITEIVIAIPKLTNEAKSKKYDFYKNANLPIKIYDYPLEESESGKRTVRDIRIEDLLFRDSINVSNAESRSSYFAKTILITGGGGSIGSELCRQIAKLSPKKLIILDIYENNAYDIQQSLIRKYGKSLDLTVEIASIRDAEKMDEIFDTYRPQIVFHAAAHKHVPLMEDCPSAAIKNNVFGTYNLVCAAEKYDVEKFIMISTDKAVNPTNVMGATKRMCEMIMQSRNDSQTKFVAVRFGNVLGSNGSVIPIFKRQIEAGGPITITDKRIIRYFMTIPEASELVLEAGAMAQRSEIFVLDMGQPVRILSLAEKMIRLAGLTPYVDIDIEEIGLRPGEKLYEELLIKSEELDKTDNSLIFIERDECPTRDEVKNKLDLLEEALATKDNKRIVDTLKSVVPTFVDPEKINVDASRSEEMKMAQQ